MIARAAALGPADLWLVLRMSLLLPLLLGLQRLMSLPRLLKLLGRRPAAATAGEEDVARLIRLTQGLLALRISIFQPNCLKQSLILFYFLRRRGFPASIHFGVHMTDGSFGSHSWIELGGEPIAEKEDPRAELNTIYSFPRAAGLAPPPLAHLPGIGVGGGA